MIDKRMLTELTAISPLDGRYAKKMQPLSAYFSEAALIRYRIKVEIEYLIALSQVPLPQLQPFSLEDLTFLRNMYLEFSTEDAAAVKNIEKTTNHDVKAVEYFIKNKMTQSDSAALQNNKEFVHFGLTSQDINNTSTPLLLKEGLQDVYLPQLRVILNLLSQLSNDWKHIPLLARTHGQPASPTGLGKEIQVFHQRLSNHFDILKQLPYPAKFGGATGNFNAHFAAYPGVDWVGFGTHFVNEILGLQRSRPTTQIEHYDGIGRILDCLKRIHTIVIDLCQDIWLYISQDYFKQQTKAGEIGSSAMPHKVNPIDFENAEGNCGISISILEFMSRKLPVSRLQRDLTDSTILRNLGVAVGHGFLALLSLHKGLGKLKVNQPKIKEDLNQNWAVLAEAIQTILRREQYPNPYEALLDLTRGKEGVNAEVMHSFVQSLDVSDEVKAEILAFTPFNYVGNALD